MTRRDAALASLAEQRAGFADLQRRFARVEPLLTGGSPFLDAIKETLRTTGASMDAEEKMARTDAGYSRLATVAEKWDALTQPKFRMLLTSGQFLRLLEAEQAQRPGPLPAALRTELASALTNFERRAADAEAALTYSVVPIKKLATVQLLTALYTLDHVQKH
jgi:hypothetical protein